MFADYNVNLPLSTFQFTASFHNFQNYTKQQSTSFHKDFLVTNKTGSCLTFGLSEGFKLKRLKVAENNLLLL